MKKSSELKLEDMVYVLSNYSLLNVEIVTNKLAKPGEKILYGFCNESEKKIYINTDLTQREKYITILHECLHAASDLFDWHLTEKETDRISKVQYEKLFKNRRY